MSKDKELFDLPHEIKKEKIKYILGKTPERSESTNKEEMLTPTNKEEINWQTNTNTKVSL